MLSIRGCYQLSDVSISNLSKCKELQILGLECKKITDDGLVQVFKETSKLEVFFLF